MVIQRPLRRLPKIEFCHRTAPPVPHEECRLIPINAAREGLR
jgi:hypothetical protein